MTFRDPVAAMLAGPGHWGAAVSRYRCEIRLKGRLTPPLATEFERLNFSTSLAPVETMVEGPVDDDAALYGLLRRLEALGLELVEVRRIDAEDKSA